MGLPMAGWGQLAWGAFMLWRGRGGLLCLKRSRAPPQAPHPLRNLVNSCPGPAGTQLVQGGVS